MNASETSGGESHQSAPQPIVGGSCCDDDRRQQVRRFADQQALDLRPLAWVRGLSASYVRGDAVAAVTVAVLLVPQAMAYALLAGLPPMIGLFAAVGGGIGYALFGVNGQASVAPTAMDALLFGAALATLGPMSPSDTVAAAVAVAMAVGLLQLGLGLLRLGFVVNFLSRPVLGGFLAAAVLLVSLSQAKHLLGIEVARSANIVTLFAAIVEGLPDADPAAVGLAIVSVLVLVALKRLDKRIPAALVVVVGGALAVAFGGGAFDSLRTVGALATVVPNLDMPSFDVQQLRALAVPIVAIAMVSFLQMVTVSSRLGGSDQQLDGDRSLLALAVANISSSLLGGQPVSAGLSRSAVNAEAGAKTPLAGLIASMLVALFLYAASSWLSYVPLVSLASVIVVSIAKMFDISEVRFYQRSDRRDLAFYGVTFLATLLVGIAEGVAIGVAMSLLAFVLRTTRPHYAILGQLPETDVFRNVLRFPNAVEYPGIVVVRVDASLYFANIPFLHRLLGRLCCPDGEPAKFVVLDASSINDLDSSAAVGLGEIIEALRQQGTTLLLAGVKGPVRDVLSRTGLHDKLGTEHCFLHTHHAVAWARAQCY